MDITLVTPIISASLPAFTFQLISCSHLSINILLSPNTLVKSQSQSRPTTLHFVFYYLHGSRTFTQSCMTVQSRCPITVEALSVTQRNMWFALSNHSRGTVRDTKEHVVYLVYIGATGRRSAIMLCSHGRSTVTKECVVYLVDIGAKGK